MKPRPRAAPGEGQTVAERYTGIAVGPVAFGSWGTTTAHGIKICRAHADTARVLLVGSGRVEALADLTRTRLKKMQYRPDVLDGFIAETGLTWTQP